MVAMNVSPVEWDQVRITAHLKRTEADLRAADVSHLSRAQRRVRAENLDALHRYWVRGVYPRNSDVPGRRVPVFIDHGGRACAVGQLMIDSGHEALAQHVALDERLEYLGTIETEGVATWIEESGLTFAELARIQPTYCNCDDEPLDPVCGVDGMTYPNTCMAVSCVGVDVEHEGSCEGNSESGNGVTDGATTGAGSSSSSGSSSSGGDGSSSSSSSSGAPVGSSSEGSSTGTTPAETDTSGCRVAGAAGWWALGLFALGWRRR